MKKSFEHTNRKWFYVNIGPSYFELFIQLFFEIQNLCFGTHRKITIELSMSY